MRRLAVLLALLVVTLYPGSLSAQGGSPPVVDPGTIEDRIPAAQASYQWALAVAKGVLKQAVTTVPPPPQWLECNMVSLASRIRQGFVDSYASTGGDPELSSLTALLEARRGLELLGVAPSDAFVTERALAERLLTKVRTLIKTYGTDRTKVPAILGLASEAARAVQLVGDPAITQPFLTEVARWLSTHIPRMLDDLKKKHDYQQMAAILLLLHKINLLGLDTGALSADSVIAQIEAATRFDLSLTLDVDDGDEQWRLEGVIPLTATVASEVEKTFVLKGEGTGSYTFYARPGHGDTMKAPDFQVRARIKPFDPCMGTATLDIDRFYAPEGETYIHGHHRSPGVPVVWAAFANVFLKNEVKDSGGGIGYRFELPLTNGDVQAVNTNVSNSREGFDGVLAVKLTHKPSR